MLRMGNKLFRQFLVSILSSNGAPRKTTPLLLQILNQCRNGRLWRRNGVCRRDDKMRVDGYVGNAVVGPIVSTDDKICAEKLGGNLHVETLAQQITLVR